MAVTFMSNLLGKDLRTFRISFSLDNFFFNSKFLVVVSRRHTLNSFIFSSSEHIYVLESSGQKLESKHLYFKKHELLPEYPKLLSLKYTY